MERHLGEALGGFCATIGTFGIPIGFPFPHFFNKNAGPERKLKKSDFAEQSGGTCAAPNVSFRHVVRTCLEDGLTRQCAGIAWRGVSSALCA